MTLLCETHNTPNMTRHTIEATKRELDELTEQVRLLCETHNSVVEPMRKRIAVLRTLHHRAIKAGSHEDHGVLDAAAQENSDRLQDEFERLNE